LAAAADGGEPWYLRVHEVDEKLVIGTFEIRWPDGEWGHISVERLRSRVLLALDTCSFPAAVKCKEEGGHKSSIWTG
jgi:hypothetical protein